MVFTHSLNWDCRAVLAACTRGLRIIGLVNRLGRLFTYLRLLRLLDFVLLDYSWNTVV